MNPAALTVSAADATRVYGDANPAFTGTITGLKNGDNITAAFHSLPLREARSAPIEITPSPVRSRSKLGNYTVTANNGTLTITAAS